MVLDKSLVIQLRILATLLYDAHLRRSDVFNARAYRLTYKNVERRMRLEGVGFFLKTLPRLGKHLDQVLTGAVSLDPASVGFKPIAGSKLPRFLGEFFKKICSLDGHLLPDPDATCVKFLRDVLYLSYKYELPYTGVQEHEVIQSFKQTEVDLATTATFIASVQCELSNVLRYSPIRRRNMESYLSDPSISLQNRAATVAREAKKKLSSLFSLFDPKEIKPRHGPGVVATKQKRSKKFLWTNVSDRITSVYPFDRYFCASAGHVCDSYQSWSKIGNIDLPAKVVLVPKDSRGPRLISCEPVDFQWVQQGLSRSIVELVERHDLTRFNVFFTDQVPNQCGALLGSSTGKYATLDLKEASDRVSLDLVRLLFPDHVLPYLEACRSTSTVLPDGEVLHLRKYAPMGSALCFPVMALTIWAILSSVAPDANTRESILVYGDDVIVPTEFVESAITWLEVFGLKLNRNKSCTQGFFRESCGVDAFKGLNVTPVRLRTVWDDSSSAEVYTSWISYANSFYDRQYYYTYYLIVEELIRKFGPIPDDDMANKQCPSLREVPDEVKKVIRRRWNKKLHKFQFRALCSSSPIVMEQSDGWSMLLRYFSEQSPRPSADHIHDHPEACMTSFEGIQPFSVRSYTNRRTAKLSYRWQG